MRPAGELTRIYAVNTLAFAALKAVSMLAGLWAARELVQALGPVEFGLVSLASAVAGYVVFMGVGLPGGLVREVARLRAGGAAGRIRPLLRSSFVLFCVVSVLGAGALCALTAWGGLDWLRLPHGTEPAARAALLATAAVVLVCWPLSVFSSTLTGMQRIPALNAVTGVAALGSAVAAVVTARRGGGAASVILATGAVTALAGLAQAALVRRAVPPAAPGAGSGRADLRGLLIFGGWLVVLEMSALMIYQIDSILLGVFVSVESVTLYYVAARLHTLVREANGLLGAALYPMVAEEHGRGNRPALEQAIYRGSRYGASLVAPLTLAALLLAGPFLRIWMGEPYVRLAPLAQAFVSYWLVASLTGIVGQVALGMGESALLAKIALAAAIVNLVVSLILVRSWGVAGVIAGTLAAYAVAIPAQVALLFPRIGIGRRRFLREVAVPVYAIVLPAGLFWWAALGWLPSPRGALALALQGSLVVATCWAALWFVAVDRRDRERVVARFQSLRWAPRWKSP